MSHMSLFSLTEDKGEVAPYLVGNRKQQVSLDKVTQHTSIAELEFTPRCPRPYSDILTITLHWVLSYETLSCLWKA